MKIRTVKTIVSAQRINMGGHLLDQPLPINSIDSIDPFLLIHHWDEPLKPGGKQSELGVGPHPHRGYRLGWATIICATGYRPFQS